MTTSTIEMDGNSYQIGKINALKQFHVSRRLGPILAAMGISLQTLAKGMKPDMMDFAEIVGPASAVLARMTDDDANYIIFECLGVVTRKQSDGRYSKVMIDGVMAFEDIELPGMLQLIVLVLQSNIGNFLKGLGDEEKLPSP